MQRNAPADQYHAQRGEGHEAQPAHLNQAQQHDLSEKAQVTPGLDQGKAGDAHGGRGGKHSLQKAQGRSVSAGGGQRQ